MEHLKFPIGQFRVPKDKNSDLIHQWIQTIAEFPSQVAKEVETLSLDDIEQTYRPEGWTIRQVVHHVADSHIHSYVRFKWTLTEDNPTIKPYEEHLWAELPDTFETPVAVSLQLLKALHQRWVVLLNALTDEDLDKTFYHPGMKKSIPLWINIALYDWHCRHHLEHIRLAKKA